VRAAALWGADSFCFNSGAGANRSPRRNTCSLVDQDLSLFNPCDKRLPRPSCCIFTTRVNTRPVALALPNEFLMLRLILLILINYDVAWFASDVALQHRLGVLPKRWSRYGPSHTHYPNRSESSLIMKALQPPRSEKGGAGAYLLFWLLGVPLPILFIIFMLRGCS
jgi:hypothetical protein